MATSIRKNFLYNSLLTAAGYIFPLITFPYVTRVLGVTNIGICNFVDSVISIFILLSMFGTDFVGTREVAKNKECQEKLNKTFNCLFWFNTITTTLALVILITITISVEQLYRHWQMMIIGGLKLLMNYMLVEWLYRGLEEFKFITIRTLSVKIIYTISVFYFIQDSSDYTAYYLLTVLSIAINAFINIIHSRKYVKIEWDSTNVFFLVRPVLFMGLYVVLTSMYTTFNIVFLGFMTNETEVGYYTTGSKITNIIIALFTAFTGVMLPRMSSLLAEGKEQIYREMLNKSNKLLFTFSIPLIIFSIIYAPTIIFFIGGSGYEGTVTPMRIMLILVLIIGYEQIAVIQALAPMNKDSIILRNSIVGATVGVILNITLVSALKSVGSSIVWLISELVVLCCAQYHIQKELQLFFPWRLLIRCMIINTPLIIILYVLLYSDIEKRTSFIIATVVSVAYFILANLRYLNEVIFRGKLEFIKRIR